MSKSISNPYPFKKIGFYPYPIYPVNGFFYCLTGSDRVGNPRIWTHLSSLGGSEFFFNGKSQIFWFFYFSYFLKNFSDK